MVCVLKNRSFNPQVLNTIQNLAFRMNSIFICMNGLSSMTPWKSYTVCKFSSRCLPFHYLMAVHCARLALEIEERGYTEREPVMKDNPAADVYHFLSLSSLEGKASKHNESRSCLQHTAACRPAPPPTSPWQPALSPGSSGMHHHHHCCMHPG